jgi:oxygen-independent coproporphyrinogen-3 oxidase
MTAIYIHWPFCKSKCHYCDFNSHVASFINIDEWDIAYLRELDYFSNYLDGKTITSIFFGGGTPSLMPPQIVNNIINRLGQHAELSNNIEITLEANPTSVEAGKFADFRAAGVTRVSLGVQSLTDADLRFLSREHSAKEALKAVEIAANTFDNYSFDLIYARPEQTISAWEKELLEALKYIKNHMSLYQLTIEKGTKFYSAHASGKFTMPDNDLAAEFYVRTQDIMEAHGLPAYEISNHAKAGFESKHNLTYWNYGDYLGIGAGAHSRITRGQNKHAMMMWHEPTAWLKSVQEKQNAIQTDTILTPEEVMEELVMMGLRIKTGISRQHFLATTGHQLEQKLANLPALINGGMIEVDALGLRATKAGFMMVNGITAKLLG